MSAGPRLDLEPWRFAADDPSLRWRVLADLQDRRAGDPDLGEPSFPFALESPGRPNRGLTVTTLAGLRRAGRSGGRPS